MLLTVNELEMSNTTNCEHLAKIVIVIPKAGDELEHLFNQAEKPF
jgi:hypothetical protein